MAFLSKLFSKKPDDYLANGERLFGQERYYEARNVFEEGLQRCLTTCKDDVFDSMSALFREKIDLANRSLAQMNICEADYAVTCGAYKKAAEHLELAKTLTDDRQLREKAESLLALIAEKVNAGENINNTSRLATSSGSCNSCSSAGPETLEDTHNAASNLAPMDYYDLLIRQLPGEMYSRYAVLGEKFAYTYLAVSNDEHEKALELLEDWFEGSSRDIYYYEKGMILHRVGKAQQAERCLLDSIAENKANPLPHLGLALLMMDSGRFDDAAGRLDAMIADNILPEQALLLRGDVCQIIEDFDGAISCYGMLLATAFSRQAAEKLHVILMHCGRQQEAETVFKRYLKGCKH